jgi:hypothetical protein|nr:MAG TPA: hypothetical protein [Bacteriophage sp.]
MDEKNEIREGVEETRGIEEGETGHRIDEFRDIVRRLDDLSDQLAAHNDAVMARLDSLASIASDNGADEGAGSYTDEVEDDDITSRDWDDLADELNI